MAEYTRFEIYLPVHYTILEITSETGQERERRYALGAAILNPFLQALQRKYHGVTQANPVAPAMYRGYWQEHAGAEVDIDHLTYVFVLVAIDETADAMMFFATWKQRLEQRLNQVVILITYSTVHTIGDFL